ncbi:MAG: ethylbenzene dehydrogenase-related protein [Tepidiformaceae bacterium]
MLQKVSNRRRTLIGVVAVLAVAALLQFTNTNPAVSQTQYITAYEVPDDPGTDPGAAVWGKITGVNVPLTAQAGAYVAGGTVQTIQAKAIHFNGRLYVRVAWPDATMDDATTRVEDFSDAVALEFPASGVSTVPSICMGQADAAVNIWQWRADSNAGLRDPNLVYANSSVDGYPSTEAIFYTARAAGNPFANPDRGPVQTLNSRAFGELTALSIQDVEGAGTHSAAGWAVVFSRAFDTLNPGHAAFAPGTRTDMAFAAWDGAQDERNGRKAVSQFVTLNIAGAPAFADEGSHKVAIFAAIGLFVAIAGIGVALVTYGAREGRN